MIGSRCFRPASLPAWQASRSRIGRLPRRTPPYFSPSIVSHRWETTSTTGDDKSGHIAAEPGEGILFLDNVFPLRVGVLVNWRPWRSTTDHTDYNVSGLLDKFDEKAATPSPLASLRSMFDPVTLVRQSIPKHLPLTVTEIIPRLKDGGVFVKFRHPASLTADDIEDTMIQSLQKKPVRPWFNPVTGYVRAGLVRGVPWLEDLASRVPSTRMRVDFCAPPPPPAADGTSVAAAVGEASGSASLELSQETIYSLFRRYGKIAEITSQPFDSKTLPRYANIDFVRIRDAVLARSCLHGHVVNGTTRLRLSYEPRVKAHHIWDWLTNHPRIVIPILAAALAAITVAVFDPIRAFFIRAHVQHSFALRDSYLYKLFGRFTSAIVSFARDSYGAAANGIGIGTGGSGTGAGARDIQRNMRALLSHRHDVLVSLQTWLLETAETFIVVQGPRGSGKRELVVDQALQGRQDVLVIDCKPIVEARGESATIKNLANAVGYWPVFSWANNISSLVDLAVQGTTGVKAGFSETLDEQVIKILQTATIALREVGLSGRHKHDADATLPEDAYLEAHPERRPVIVLDNFGQRNEEATGFVYDKLAEWAATLVQTNTAHVIFLTTDTSYPKPLVKAMPDRVFRQVALGDLSPSAAKKYVLSHLQDQETDEDGNEKEDTSEKSSEGAASGPVTLSGRRDIIRELDECIGVLGGRLTDLESLVRRLEGGQRPQNAVSEIVEQGASEIIKMFLLAPARKSASGSSGPGTPAVSGGGASGAAGASSSAVAAVSSVGQGRPWTAEQAWYLVRELATRESLRYNEVLLADTFSSDGVAALEALAATELVTIRSAHGRPQTIRAGSPVYQAAFVQLQKDTALRARLDRALLAESTAYEERTVAKIEQELALLGVLPKQPAQLAERITRLLTKAQASEAKISAYEKDMLRLKKVLSEEV